jgi:hypothetical protein
MLHGNEGSTKTQPGRAGPIRSYLPKDTDFDMITEEQTAKVKSLIDNRPGKYPGCKTPLEIASAIITACTTSNSRIPCAMRATRKQEERYVNINFYISKLLDKLLISRGIYLFDTKTLQCYYERDERIKLYREGLGKSGSQSVDNIYKQFRFNSLLQLLEHVIKEKIDGEYAECGCWKGHSSYLICKTLSLNNYNKTYHIFDSFEGLSEKLPIDKHLRYDFSQNRILKEMRFFGATQDEVKKTLSDFNFVKTYKGWIPERFDEVKDLHFAFVHIDVDLYQPTLDSLKFFYPRLSKGGAIVVDDYGMSAYPGCKKAVDEFLSDNDCEFFYEIPIGGCFILKTAVRN